MDEQRSPLKSELKFLERLSISKPSSIWVIRVFSSDSSNPRVCRKSRSRVFASSAISLVAAVTIKSSAYGRLFGAVVDDPVNHAVIVLHRHFRIFQRVRVKKTGDLLKAKAIAVMAG